MQPVEESLAKIKAKFEVKLHNKERNPDGILTCTLQDYFGCLELGITQLEQNLARDQKKWENNLKLTKEGLDRMTKTLSAIVNE